MNIKDSAVPMGYYEVIKRDKGGNIVPLWQENRLGSWIFKNFNREVRLPLLGAYQEVYSTPNMVVNGGLAALVDRFGDVNSIAKFSYLALGSGDTAVTAADTTLETELTADGLERAEGTDSLETTTTTDDTLQLTKTFTYTGSSAVTINELGALNAASVGTMASRTVITGKTVDTSGETLAVTYKLVMARPA